MDPFGNFGWNFGFGFGWILVGVFALLMILGIAFLAGSDFKGPRSTPEKEAELEALKRAVCENRISVDEFDDKIHALV